MTETSCGRPFEGVSARHGTPVGHVVGGFHSALSLSYEARGESFPLDRSSAERDHLTPGMGRARAMELFKEIEEPTIAQMSGILTNVSSPRCLASL